MNSVRNPSSKNAQSNENHPAASLSDIRLPKQFKPNRSIHDGPFAYWVQGLIKEFPEKFNEQTLTPSRAELELISKLAYQSDELADNLAIEILNSKGLAKEVDKGLREGVDSLVNPPKALKDFLAYYENIPDWVDMHTLLGDELHTRFSESSSRNKTELSNNMLILVDGLGMVTGFFIGGNYPAVGTALVRSGSAMNGPSRYTQTENWAYDVMGGPKNFEKYGIAIVSCAKVRLAHAFARIQMKKKGAWDEDYYGLPISEFDNMVFLSGIFAFLDLTTPMMRRNKATFFEAIAINVQYLMGAPESLIRLSTEEKSRLFVMSIAHLDDSPETAREVYKSFIHAKEYFRDTSTLRGKISRDLTFLVANVFTRLSYGNKMADSIGMKRFHRGIYVPAIAATLNWLKNNQDKIYFRGFRPLIKIIRKMYASTSLTQPAEPKKRENYKGSYGVFD